MRRHFDLSPEEWAALRRLLDEALDLPAAERPAWIDALGAPHLAFKPRLRALLAHADGSPEQLLRTLPKIETADFAAAVPDQGCAGAGHEQHVGPYRLLRQIGEGGMASVWLAERGDVLQRRQVALKLPHGTWRRAAWAARLTREREILATLEHPNIARLYDAGVAPDGQPYLALEYVQGQPIDAHCRERGLDVRQRLRLFLQVSHAVAHAHSRLVVHRDLKPSNILVTADGKVRLLDFGIAKLLEQGLAQETELTREVGRAMTPDYAAPEQIRGEPIGTAADVYSLGVVLFELLAGERPYKLRRDSRAAVEEAILKAEPIRPSEAASDAKLRKQLRGDLDTIVLKALKKAPSERYATVDALAADVECWLKNWPVTAQPDSRWYRVRKFVVRNRVLVGAASSITLAVLGGAGATAWQAHEARAEARRAEEVKAFIVSIFREADPYVGTREPLTAAALLKQARARLDQGLASRAETRIELLHLIASSLHALQEPAAADEAAQTALRDARQAWGEQDPRTLRLRVLATSIMRIRGKTQELRGELDELLPLLARVPGVAIEDRLRAMQNEVQLLIDEGRYADAVAAGKAAHALSVQRLGTRHSETGALALVIAMATKYAGPPEAALAAAQTAFSSIVELHPGDAPHPKVIDARSILGRALAEAGHRDEGLQHLRRAADDASRLFGEQATMTAFFRGTLARHELEAGDPAKARASLERAMPVVLSVSALDSVNHAAVRHLDGLVWLLSRRPERAVEPLADASRKLASLMGPQHPLALAARMHHATALATSRADNAAMQALEQVAAAAGNGSGRTLDWPLYFLGQAQRLHGHPVAAAASQEAMLTSLPADARGDAARTAALAELGLAEIGAGRVDRAAAALSDAATRLGGLDAITNPIAADAAVGLGRVHLAHSRPQQALPLLERADAFWQQFDASNRAAGETALWLARCHAAMGHHTKARGLHARAVRLLKSSPFASDAVSGAAPLRKAPPERGSPAKAVP